LAEERVIRCIDSGPTERATVWGTSKKESDKDRRKGKFTAKQFRASGKTFRVRLQKQKHGRASKKGKIRHETLVRELKGVQLHEGKAINDKGGESKGTRAKKNEKAVRGGNREK